MPAMAWTTTELVTVVGAIGTGVGAVLGVFLTKGVDAWIRIRKTGMEEQAQEDAATVAGYKLAVDQLTALLSTLQVERAASIKAHADCMKETGILAGKVEILIEQNKHLVSEVAGLREEVNRLSRHEKANLDQLKEYQRSLNQLERESGPHLGPDLDQGPPLSPGDSEKSS
jgi:hypothetical protein